MRRVLSMMLASASVFAACAGPPGKDGKDGAAGAPGQQGPPGEQGPPGPLTTPPTLTTVAPRAGSARSRVTLTGTGFSTLVDDNHVFFDGQRATVLAASETSLTVEPSLPVAEPRTVFITVEVAHQGSNAVGFTLLPSGFAVDTEALLPSAATGVVALGAALFIASGMFTQPLAGLYRRDADGVTTRVLASSLLDLSDGGDGPDRLFDAPLALATDGTLLYFTTLLGAVRSFDPATGVVQELLAPNTASLGNDEFPGRPGLAVAGAGATAQRPVARSRLGRRVRRGHRLAVCE